MGCSKNLVDSEKLARRFLDAGFEVIFESDEIEGNETTPDYVVINTCGFIGDAKEESIEKTMDYLAAKAQGDIKGVYIMGCLGERYRKELEEEIPELDGIYGKFDWTGLVADLAQRETPAPSHEWDRELSTEPHYTYIKISEGCNRFCAFCAIPLITGRHHSRTVEDIVDEVTHLASEGTCEFNIIAQDLSSYGTDLPGGKSRLAELIDALAVIPGVEMIRLHYAYPADFPYDVLDAMARHKNVCRYLDIALQHIDDKVLSNMRRHITADETRALLARIREAVPGIAIRTTLMVGFPGEDDDAFERLMDFVREQRFERMGAFAYCEEDDTYAARNFADDIPQEVKDERLSRLMDLQQEIAFETAEAMVGKTLRVIIDEQDADGQYIGRTEFDSPEVDCNVYLPSEPTLEPGCIYNVEIIGSDAFDLLGKVI
ncbi:MAG: 30S ribosomal protein S12 methylthiotransferase RimO [Muribaculaceae bacterium]|nr:30S ribosomal protein S12 methylthiotransferase RimO [Muribaculaceae bacterium]